MTNHEESAKDYAPFPIPFPESTGFSPLDSDNRKEWRKDYGAWVATHGHPDDKPDED